MQPEMLIRLIGGIFLAIAALLSLVKKAPEKSKTSVITSGGSFDNGQWLGPAKFMAVTLGVACLVYGWTKPHFTSDGASAENVDQGSNAEILIQNALRSAGEVADMREQIVIIGDGQNAARRDASPHSICEESQSSGCVSAPSMLSAKARRSELMHALADAGDYQAIRGLWNEFSAERRQEILKSMLARVKEDPNLPAAQTAWVADELYAGTYLMRDTRLAYVLSGQAWQRGDGQSANTSAGMAFNDGDLLNAYFWSLRCVSPACSRTSFTLELDQLEIEIPEATRAQIEAAAQQPKQLTFSARAKGSGSP